MDSRIKTFFILLVVMAAAIGYALTPQTIGEGQLSLKKVSLSGLISGYSPFADADSKSVSPESGILNPLQQRKNLQQGQGVLQQEADYSFNTHHRILFIGDSMLEGLMRRFADYAAENGHELNVVLWYSSSTERWATTPVLRRYLKEYQPTYVVICLGSNELFARDLPEREKYVSRIVQQLDSVPFVWISAPNWRKDTGINDIIARHVGKRRFFDSRRLQLERGSDHKHPTMHAAAQWMDSVAVWMSSTQTARPIQMNRPKKKGRAAHITLLQPDYEG